MKKLLFLGFTIFSIILSLTACDMFEGIFGGKSGVSKEYYENCAVFTFDDFDSSFCKTLDRTVLGEGTIYYQVNLEKGSLSVKYSDVGLINENQLLSEFTADGEMPINGSGGYIEGDKIAITFEAFSPVSGEIIIAFTEDALKAVHGNLQLHKHTCTYTSAGKVGHFTTFTCGCASDDGTTPHYDGNTDYLCDYCKCDMTEFADEWQYDETHHWYISDDQAVYCYGEHENWDADLNCDICGYRFDHFTPTNHFLRNQAGCEWLNEITAEDIAQIKITEGAVGVAPGMLNDITTSSKSDVIAELFEKYYWLDTSPIPKEDGMICGGGAVTVQFVLKTGEVKELYLNNGNYCDTYGNYFDLLYTPKFTKEMNPYWCNSFITYVDTGIVYSTKKDDSSISPIEMLGQISVGKLEFNYMVAFEFLPDFYPDAYGVYVQTEFGKLKFISPTIFDYEGIYCILVGKSIEDLVDTSGVTELVDAHEAKYDDGRVATVELYYGEYPSGAVVGMIVDDKTAYTEAEWSETVRGYRFDYNYGNRIVVLYGGEFYTLSEAIENGCLTKSEIALIYSIHNY